MQNYPTNLPGNTIPRVSVTHDECALNSKDVVCHAWAKDVIVLSLIEDMVSA